MDQTNLKANFCQKCKQEKELYTGKLCGFCLIIVLEKRIKKNIKEQGGLRRNDKILFLINNSLESKASEYFFKKIFSEMPLEIDYEDKGKQYDKLIIPGSSESIIEEFLDALFSNKKFNFGKQLIFLESLTGEEIKDVAKIKNFSEKLIQHELLDKIEEKYPGSKLSLLKSIKVLES